MRLLLKFRTGNSWKHLMTIWILPRTKYGSKTRLKAMSLLYCTVETEETRSRTCCSLALLWTNSNTHHLFLFLSRPVDLAGVWQSGCNRAVDCWLIQTHCAVDPGRIADRLAMRRNSEGTLSVFSVIHHPVPVLLTILLSWRHFIERHGCWKAGELGGKNKERGRDRWTASSGNKGGVAQKGGARGKRGKGRHRARRWHGCKHVYEWRV